jgi:hypothetical protein
MDPEELIMIIESYVGFNTPDEDTSIILEALRTGNASLLVGESIEYKLEGYRQKRNTWKRSPSLEEQLNQVDTNYYQDLWSEIRWLSQENLSDAMEDEAFEDDDGLYEDMEEISFDNPTGLHFIQ